MTLLFERDGVRYPRFVDEWLHDMSMWEQILHCWTSYGWRLVATEGLPPAYEEQIWTAWVAVCVA